MKRIQISNPFSKIDGNMKEKKWLTQSWVIHMI